MHPYSTLPSATAPFVIVANRLPIEYVNGEVRPSPGGLARALTSVAEERGGTWIGWPGSTAAFTTERVGGIGLVGVEISEEEIESYYLGFCNATLWPLYHDAIRPPVLHRDWWEQYQILNRRFAEATAVTAAEGALVWVHDYQLQLVPKMLRALRPDLRIGFFLHIHFPPAELFAQLPWRHDILEGMLGADLVGFQTHQGAANFVRLARRFTGAKGADGVLEVDGRQVRVGAFGISVDSKQITEMSATRETANAVAKIRADLGGPQRIFLGVERLDYTKGIYQRIRALAELLADGTLDPETTALIQVAVPSRESDPHYERERKDVEQLIGEVNGTYGHLGHPVIHYIHHGLGFEELVALYKSADVMLVTPFRDGMNLVAKEYVMARNDLEGALVLSEFAGAAEELRGAYLVNPYDIESIKDGVRAAIRADEREKRRRMVLMRRRVLRRDVYVWAESFLNVLAGDIASGEGDL